MSGGKVASAKETMMNIAYRHGEFTISRKYSSDKWHRPAKELRKAGLVHVRRHKKFGDGVAVTLTEKGKESMRVKKEAQG